MLEEDFVVHDVVQAALHDLFLVRCHLDAEEATYCAQVTKQGDDVLDALLADYVRSVKAVGDLQMTSQEVSKEKKH